SRWTSRGGWANLALAHGGGLLIDPDGDVRNGQDKSPGPQIHRDPQNNRRSDRLAPKVRRVEGERFPHYQRGCAHAKVAAKRVAPNSHWRSTLRACSAICSMAAIDTSSCAGCMASRTTRDTASSIRSPRSDWHDFSPSCLWSWLHSYKGILPSSM